METKRFRKTLVGSFLAVSFLFGTSSFTRSAVASVEGASVETPSGTAADHLAKAEAAHITAAAFREVAARNRQELEKERKSIAILLKAPENPWWRKAREHYQPLIEDDERRAAEADRLAAYHQFRAAEVQGK